MKSISLLLVAIFFSSQVAALGPIPAGTYKGISTCFSSEGTFSYKTTHVIGIDSMETITDQQRHVKKFVFSNYGSFTINPNSENGHGYFSGNGMYYTIVINGIRGEDFFYMLSNELKMKSSASVDGIPFLCEGSYPRVSK